MSGVAAVRDSLSMGLVGRTLYGSSFCTAVGGNRLYVGSGPTLLEFDVSNPSIPELKGHLYLDALIGNIALDGDSAYIAATGEGLVIVDCSVPEHPLELGTYRNESGGSTYGVFARNDTDWVADGLVGLLVVDCTNRYQPAWWDITTPGTRCS